MIKHNKQLILNERQIRNRYQIRAGKLELALLVILALIIDGIYFSFFHTVITSPCPDSGCYVKVVYAKDEQPDMARLLDQTALEFAPEGSSVVHDAINVLWCEHRFNGVSNDVPHENDNGTRDFGPFQINSLWVKVFGDKFETDWKENIRVAHKIWLRSHSFEAWSCVSVYHVL